MLYSLVIYKETASFSYGVLFLLLLCSKIGKLTLARLLIAHDVMISHNSPNTSSVVHSEEVLGLYQDLMNMDPAHSQYYKDEYSSVLLKKVSFFPNSCCWGEGIFFIWSLVSDLVCDSLKVFFYRHIIELIKI